MSFNLLLKSLGANSSGKFLSRRFLSANRPLFSAAAKKHITFSEKDGYVVNSPFGPIPNPRQTIDQYVWQNMSNWQHHVAIECGRTGRTYTYAKLRDHCAALAIQLRNKLKLQKHDFVGICLPNVPEYVIAFLGSIEGGLAVTTVNPGYTIEEICRQFVSCEPKAVFCLLEHVKVVREATVLAKQPHIKIIAIKSETERAWDNGVINFDELINPKGLNLSDSDEYNKDVKYHDTILLPYSSGTTGLPKGVMLTHHNLVSNCQSLSANLPHEPLVLPTTNDYQDVLPCFLPFFHIYGLMVALTPKLALGAKIVTMPKFDVADFLRICAEKKATMLHLVPPIVILLNNLGVVKPEHFKNVKRVMCGASSLGQSDAEPFLKIAKNAVFVQGYGMTEASPIISIAPLDSHNYAAVGAPMPNIEMKIADINDATFKGLAANEVGEILVRGPNVMKGYFKNEEATRDTITEDKWLRSGDIGHFDEEGLLYISDRLKELIKVNANQVAPAELEAILREHPAILDAVVIGIPHSKCGEVPKAFVIRRPESNLSEVDVQLFVAKQVIKYKQLTGGIQFVDHIPKSATGKVLRREVRQKFV